MWKMYIQESHTYNECVVENERNRFYIEGQTLYESQTHAFGKLLHFRTNFLYLNSALRF